MKSSITKKLILYFGTILLIFAFVIGLLFTILFVNNMTEHNKVELKKRANTIGETLALYLEGKMPSNGMQRHSNGQGQRGFGIFLELIDDIAMGEVWLVDKNTNLITRGNHNPTMSFDNLPQDGEKLIQNALKGDEGYSQSFSQLVGAKSITVCVPVYSEEGAVLAAVLLHASVEDIQESIVRGLWILFISMCIALILSAVIAILMSKRFIHPIKVMNQAAKKLAEGEYSQRTYIHQKDEIGELASSLDKLSTILLTASQQREQLEKERQEFYGDISHELRTPVTVMRGSLEALRDGKVESEEKKQEYYDQMIVEAQYMQDMVNDLLDLSKLKNPDYILEKEFINLSDVLSDTVRGMRRIAEQKQIAIELDNEIPQIEIWGNYAKLRQMFLIVLDNAVKFSLEKGRVAVSVKKENEQYVVSICDHGLGIVQKDIPYIFERFYRNKSSDNQGGTGIGLAITGQIAERHNIKITVDSKEKEGTCFYFIL